MIFRYRPTGSPSTSGAGKPKKPIELDNPF